MGKKCDKTEKVELKKARKAARKQFGVAELPKYDAHQRKVKACNICKAKSCDESPL